MQKNVTMELKEQILAAWANRDLLKEETYADAVRTVIEEVDKGRLLLLLQKADGRLTSG